MDLGKFIQDAADGAGHAVRKFAQMSSDVVQAVGGGAAELTRNAAQTTEHFVDGSARLGHEVTRGFADFTRDNGRAIGISAVTDIVAGLEQGIGGMAVDAFRAVSNAPIATARGTADVISFVANTSSSAITATSGAAAEGLSLAVRPKELVRWVSQILLNTAYEMVIERWRRFSLQDSPLTSTSVMVILILAIVLLSYISTICLIFPIAIISAIIVVVEWRRFRSRSLL